jgi:transcriptional regulator with XRE-family HTH domain
VNLDGPIRVVMDLAQKLAANLRTRRGNKTQEEFARKLGISRATLSRLESAAQNTTISTLGQISKSLRCDVGELFVTLKE